MTTSENGCGRKHLVLVLAMIALVLTSSAVLVYAMTAPIRDAATRLEIRTDATAKGLADRQHQLEIQAARLEVWQTNVLENIREIKAMLKDGAKPKEPGP